MTDCYWVPHAELVLAPCKLVKKSPKDVAFVDDDSNVITLPLDDLATLGKVHRTQLEGLDNVCNLEEVSKGALLHTIRVRYKQGEIYTRVARIVVAVNPFKALNIYSSKYVDKYIKARDSMDLPPHVYGVGLDAVSGLWGAGGKNQAVLISGESGAGKTESTKLMLAYIGEALSGGSTTSRDMQDMIMQTTPVLEAFGNAMTVRNNNSSRFGKWTELQVAGASMQISGCVITDYLLELSRVCNPGPKERSYHIFYQLLQNRKSPELKSLGIEAHESYQYLKHALPRAPGIDDAREFEMTKDAFKVLGFNEELQGEIFQIIMGILNLGNCQFKGDEAAEAVDLKPFAKGAELLSVSVEALQRLILKRYIMVGTEELEAQCSPDQAKAAMDGLGKLLYGRLFSWIVKCTNKSLASKEEHHGKFFGVLDIAGFESFEENSLEQLFINLSNEELQNYFNDHVFKQELYDCEEEGVLQEATLSFEDNGDILELLCGRGGILPLLDEEVALPKGTDEAFHSKLIKAQKEHKRFVNPRFQKEGGTAFGIHHFAGDVTYSCQGFIAKNRDRPPKEAPNLLQGSSNSVLQGIGEVLGEEVKLIIAEGALGKSKKPKTISTGFRASLKELMDKLHEATPHFIRCVKPNLQKVPNKFDSKIVVEQLAAAGVMETVRIKQEGFQRVDLAEFFNRYQFLAPKQDQKKIFGPNGPKDTCEKAKALVAVLPAGLSAISQGLETKGMFVGKTKVFVKRKTSHALERGLDIAVIGQVVNIQRIFRGRSVRQRYVVVMQKMRQVRDFMKKNNFYQTPGSSGIAITRLNTTTSIMEQVEAGKAILDGAMEAIMGSLCVKLRELVTRMESEAKVIDQLTELRDCVEPTEMDKILARAKALDLPEDPFLIKRCRQLKIQLPYVKAMTDALESKDLGALQLAFESVKQAENSAQVSKDDWLPELKGLELVKQVNDMVDGLKARKKLDDKKAALMGMGPVEKRAQKSKFGRGALNDEARAAGCDGVLDIFAGTGEGGPGDKEDGPGDKEGDDDDEETEDIASQPLVRKGGRTRTVTAFSPQQQVELLKTLAEASEAFDVVALEENLGLAMVQGLPPSDIEEFEALFVNLQTASFIIESIRVAADAVTSTQKASPQALQILRNLIAHAKELKIAEELIEVGTRALQQGVRRRVRATIRGSIFEKDMFKDPEMQLIEDTFDDLYNFPNLKDPKRWKGHCKGKKQAKDETMLCHSHNEIKEALTNVPAHNESASKAAYRDLLGWMLDRPSPEVLRIGLAQDIVDVAKSAVPLGDEIYIQVMKQLRDNPSTRSETLGWQLLLNLCQGVRPSEGLQEFVRTFLLQKMAAGAAASATASAANRTFARQQMDTESVNMAKQCMKDLNILDAPGGANIEEDGQLIPVQVLLIDTSIRKVHVKPSESLKELGEKMGEQLKINAHQDFSFYLLQSTSSVGESIEGYHKLLPDDTIFLTLSEEMARESNSSIRLLYKRRFLRTTERLNTGDLVHATLTYRQALWEYLHYPICEETDYICQIAATILCLESSHYEKYMAGDQLAQADMLEQILPKVMLPVEQRGKRVKVLNWIGVGSDETKKRSKYAQQLTEAYTQIKKSMTPGETRLMQMNRIMNMMQRLRLFGTCRWVGRQNTELTSEQRPICGPPGEPHPELQITNREASLFICVDLWGLRFWSLDDASLDVANQCFPFAWLVEMYSVKHPDWFSDQKVTDWAANVGPDGQHHTLQFVVQTSAEPGIAQTILLDASVAEDVVHTMNVACLDSKSTRLDDQP